MFRQISNAPNADANVLALFNEAVSDMQAAGADIVEDFTIKGNAMGDDWDAWRGGQG